MSRENIEPQIFDRIREILESARSRVARTVNTTQVMANWLIGREIVEEEQQGKKRAGYGEALLAELSRRLGETFGRGFSVDNLEAFRQFYLEYPELISDTLSRKSLPSGDIPEISDTASRKFPDDVLALPASSSTEWQPGRLHPSLSWSHYRALLRVGRREARSFYEIEAIRNAWAVRELSRQVSSLLFDRLAKSKDKEGLLRLIDLKVGKLSHGDLGQIQFYVNYYDRERLTEGDNPTIGLVLCPDKNDAVVKYTLGEQLKRNIFTSRYQLYLPTVEELEQELQREMRYLTPPESDTERGQKP